MGTILLTLLVVIMCLQIVGIPTFFLWRNRNGKQLIKSHIEEKGGTVKNIRLHMAAFSSEYEVSYVSKELQGRFATCITRCGVIYWSSDKAMEITESIAL
jgi:hypothetical protein